MTKDDNNKSKMSATKKQDPKKNENDKKKQKPKDDKKIIEEKKQEEDIPTLRNFDNLYVTKEWNVTRLTDAWTRFFNECPYKNYIAEIKEISDQTSIDEEGSVYVDFWHIDKWSDTFAEAILLNPMQFVHWAAEAISGIQPLDHRPMLYLRIKNLPKSCEVKIGEIRKKHIGQLVQIKGRINIASNITVKYIVGHWQCEYCLKVTKVPYPDDDNDLKKPLECIKKLGGCGRSNGKYFKLLKKESLKIDYQTIEVEELFDMTENRQPQKINCFLASDIVGSVWQSEEIIINGVVDAYQPMNKELVNEQIFGIRVLSMQLDEVKEDLEPNEEEVKQMAALAVDPLRDQKIKASLCPEIIGWNMVKFGMLHLIASPEKIELPNGTTKRGKIHVMLCGDPAVAKSDMIIWMLKLHPIRIFASGTGIKSTGLTAAAMKNEMTGKYELNLGVIPKANGGVCGLDEVDKTDEKELSCLNIPMEHGIVNVNKGGFHLSLHANTSILFGCNPKKRKFDRYKGIFDQITFPKDLRSRLDLIFVMYDEPDQERDRRIAESILDSWCGNPKSANAPIPYELLKKYIYHAIKNVHPVMNPEMNEIIIQKYLSLRGTDDENGNSPLEITARQLQTLIRITLAHAKIRHSENVLLEDVETAFEIFFYSMKQAVGDEDGNIDILSIETGWTKKDFDRVETIKNIILAEPGGMHIGAILDKARTMGFKDLDTSRIVNRMKEDGDLYEFQHDFICLMGR